ncbi:hypothetical protein Scep_000721 [Stephania cephalantha]|uniref:Uncharacterized protein n=1 Tax=Stephania cephalantha TaxID=152367 RepID=A0AAP0L7N3_9MAGN
MKQSLITCLFLFALLLSQGNDIGAEAASCDIAQHDLPTCTQQACAAFCEENFKGFAYAFCVNVITCKCTSC